MKRTGFLLTILTFACAPETTRSPDPTYCGNNEGDAFCVAADPAAPFCLAVFDECTEAAEIDIKHPNGCVSDMPAPECRYPCGMGNGDDCLDPTVTEGSSESSTGDDTEPTSTTVEPETDTEEPTSTTGPECSEDVPCMDAAAPFCVEGSCSTCDASVDPAPDDACAMLDEGMPLCVGATCVQCTVEDASACGGTTPLCDAEANTCVGCSFHEECQDLDLHACNIATGACFSADAASVSEVDAGSNGAIQAAIGAVADGAEHTIVLTGGGGNHTVTVDGGKTIAIVSSTATVHSVRGNNGSPVITVTGAGTTAYLHRLRVEDTDDVGIAVASGATLYADSTQVAGNDDGGITLAAGTSGFIRNCMVGGAADAVTFDASSATVELLYSSVLGGLGDADGFVCSSGINISIRNSIITTRGSTPALGCVGADVSNTTIENTGMTSWFTDYNGGDAHLEAAGQALFATEATWELGDPPFDFDGDDRPNTDGAADFAGADEP